MEDTTLPNPSNRTGTDGSQSDQQAIMMQQIRKMAEELAKLQKKEELREARRQKRKESEPEREEDSTDDEEEEIVEGSTQREAENSAGGSTKPNLRSTDQGKTKKAKDENWRSKIEKMLQDVRSASPGELVAAAVKEIGKSPFVEEILNA